MSREPSAVVLAAGLGKRLLPYTETVPKCLVPVCGEPILSRTLKSLSRHGVTRATIVVGYLKDAVKQAVGESFEGLQIDYVDVDAYRTTNNIYSLWQARQHLDRDVLLLEGDVLFEDAVIQRLLESGPQSMVVAPYGPRLSGSVVRLEDEGCVESLILKSEQGEDFDFADAFKTVNLYYFSGEFLCQRYLPLLSQTIERGDVHLYYESVLKDLIASGGAAMRAVDVGDCLWWEVDDSDDLERANYLFSNPAARYKKVTHLYGGHWRFDFADHNHLYNLHFPPQELIEGLRADLPAILTSYPPGQAEMARLLSQWTGCSPEHIVVANGSAELIRIICGQLTRGLCVAEPSFNEYENSVPPEQYHPFFLDKETFDLDVAGFADAVIESNSNLAVVITPNNPTALSVPREQLLELLERLSSHDCMVLVDESFIDFSRAGYASTLETEVDRYPNLAVIKSMSKTFGIAGIRLGYLVTANAAFAGEVRRRLPIWNINGFSEAVLRALAGYRKQFEASLDQVRSDCAVLYEGLRCIPGLEVFPPDANFVFCRVNHPDFDGPSLALRLFSDYGMFIKDCSNKTTPGAARYIRVGSRTAEENWRLVAAIAELLGGPQAADGR